MDDGEISERDRAAALGLPREPVGTAYVPENDPVQGAIDEELKRKYVAEPSSVEEMLSAEALGCTLRIERA